MFTEQIFTHRLGKVAVSISDLVHVNVKMYLLFVIPITYLETVKYWCLQEPLNAELLLFRETLLQNAQNRSREILPKTRSTHGRVLHSWRSHKWRQIFHILQMTSMSMTQRQYSAAYYLVAILPSSHSSNAQLHCATPLSEIFSSPRFTLYIPFIQNSENSATAESECKNCLLFERGVWSVGNEKFN